MKGFKSFPGKTRLDFGPGVSVIVGPNGSGKSNIADAIVWALGEQSPGAVRGGQMQDLLFGGGGGLASASAAEVELIFDNADGTLESDFSELAITRRLGRDGEGEYRINGARCRLADVIEVLSDTGLGKEMHSVLSQGKVDEIVASKPRDRRLLVEEAAGLGKHRKRRRRAQLKLAKTRDNLDRVLDVEREARSRLKPLKRQAEAAETHARLELQANELRAEQAADQLLRAGDELRQATEQATAARAAREQIEGQLAEVARLREATEQKLAAESARREQATESLYSVRSVSERLAGVRERADERIGRLTAEVDRHRAELGQLELDVQPQIDSTRIAQLEAELAEIERQGLAELESELADMRRRLELARGELTDLETRAAQAHAAAQEAEQASAAARRAVGEAQQSLAATRRERARLEGELGAVEQYLSEAASDAGADALARQLSVTPGYEIAVSAVLGGRLRAAVVEDLASGQSFLDRLGETGGSAMLAEAARSTVAGPPLPGATRLLDKIQSVAASEQIVAAVLADAWLVDSLEALPADFAGVAVTPGGRVFVAATGELRQVAGRGEQRMLSERNRHDALDRRLSTVKAAENAAQEVLEKLEVELTHAETARDDAHQAAREARVARDELAGGVTG
ncbi:MAG: chromosome segregation SMC family protein, partial [Solirubrobacterales bacterium]